MNTPCIMLRYSDNKTPYIHATSISRCSYNATLHVIVIICYVDMVKTTVVCQIIGYYVK